MISTTEDNTPDAAGDDEPGMFNPPKGTDFLLAFYSDLAEIAGVEQDVILTVGGTIISGRIISGRKYFELLAERFGEEYYYIETIKKFATLFPEEAQGKEDAFEALGKTPRHYIYLADAKHYVNGDFVPNNGTPWRGKMEHISGFAFGALKKG